MIFKRKFKKVFFSSITIIFILNGCHADSHVGTWSKVYHLSFKTGTSKSAGVQDNCSNIIFEPSNFMMKDS